MLQVKKIQFGYTADKDILRGISLRVDQGEIVAIVGDTGAGKTTLLKCLAGFFDLKHGAINLHNTPVLGPEFNLIPGHDRIKHVAQDFNLLRNHTAFENVIADLHQYHKYEKKNIGNRLLKALNIYQLRNKMPRMLSGGQQQRIALAKALAEKPDFLLLDEPFNQQDSWNKGEVLSAIKVLAKEEKIGVVMVTHQYEDALYLADTVMVMERGKIVQKGSPSDVYFHPKNEKIASLFGDYLLFENKITRPQHIHVSNTPTKLIAKVLENRFKGNRYEILIQLEDQKVSILVDQPILAEQVYLQID